LTCDEWSVKVQWSVSNVSSLIAAAVGLQAHLKADKYYSVIANMRGESTEEVANKICTHSVLRGLQVNPSRQKLVRFSSTLVDVSKW
jgi:hypothetical protein